MGNVERLLIALAITGLTAAAIAQETITYSYDARGRLVRVVSNSSGNSVSVNYSYDKADNRNQVVTTGAPK